MNSLSRSHRYLFLILIIVLVAPVLSACGAKESVTLAPESALPAFVEDAPPTVQEAYLFAIANPHELEKYPCYCGCNSMGHMNNRSCYIADFEEDGTPIFDNHATGCGICVDITQDVIRLTEDGKSDQEIRSYVDATYSSFGPSTETPLP